MIDVIAGTILGGFGFRFRGGMFANGLPHWVTRGAWSLSAVVVPALTTPMLILGAPLLFLGTLIGWFSSIDLGRIEGVAWRDYLMNAIRGLMFTLPILPLLWYLGITLWPAFIGILCPLVYELGWRIPSKIKNLQTGPEIGELLFGMLVAGTFAAFL